MSGRGSSPPNFFLQCFPGYSYAFLFPYSINLYNSIKRCIDVFIEIVFDLLTNLGRTNIFTMLSHPSQEKGMISTCSSLLLCLFRTVLNISLYKFFHISC